MWCFVSIWSGTGQTASHKEFYILYELRTHLLHFGCYISDIVAISTSPFRRDYAIVELIFEDRSEIWQ